MQIFATVISGVLVFVIGQMIIKLWLEPVHKFKRTISDIALYLAEHAQVIAGPGLLGSKHEELASQELKRLYSQLSARMYLIPCYKHSAWILNLPSVPQVDDAVRHLRGLSNGMSKGGVGSKNTSRSQRIKDALGIYTPPHDRTD